MWFPLIIPGPVATLAEFLENMAVFTKPSGNDSIESTFLMVIGFWHITAAVVVMRSGPRTRTGWARGAVWSRVEGAAANGC